MSKTYLTVAAHWDTPGIRQYASTERVHAERKAAELVDELIDMFADDFKDEIAASKGMLAVPPKVAQGGNDWRATLRALQLARLIEIEGGEGEANDTLYHFCCTMRAEEEPPLIGEGFTPALQDVIERFVAEDDCDADKIGFPMVWIEEVDAAEPPADLSGDLETVLQLAERFAAEGAIADEPGAAERALAAIHRLRTGQPHAAVSPAEPITIAVTIEGGVMQGSVASRGGVRLYVVDFDQDGVEQGQLVDMAGPDDSSEEWASVWQDNTTVDAAEVARIIAKAEERAVREHRFDNNECILCGNDLASPSAAGAEDGICGECLKGGDE